MENNFYNPKDLSAKNENNNYFNVPGDLESKKAATGNNNYFSAPGDLESKKAATEKNNLQYDVNDIENIQKYLSSITSGISYRNDPNYEVFEGGSRLLPLTKINKMKEEGYNIIKAEPISVLNNEFMVAVEFEKLIPVIEEKQKKSR